MTEIEIEKLREENRALCDALLGARRDALLEVASWHEAQRLALQAEHAELAGRDTPESREARAVVKTRAGEHAAAVGFLREVAEGRAKWADDPDYADHAQAARRTLGLRP